jgi:hypothetical protein
MTTQVSAGGNCPRHFFWAKTGGDGAFAFKTVAHHCADVAAFCNSSIPGAQPGTLG